MLSWDDDLRLAGTPLYLDSRRPRPLCLVSHAHSDHLPQNGCHDRAVATAATAELAEYRIGMTAVDRLAYGETAEIVPGVSVSLSPAGHVLGSAMARLEYDGGSLLYTGDFKLRPSLTVAPADPPTADYLLMECTYGLPMFRFPDWRQVQDRLRELVAAALAEGRQPIVLGYSLGKAQEIVRILTDAGLPVTCHGAVASMCDLYQKMGVPLGAYRRYKLEDFHGKAALDLAERGALVAPPQVARSAFVNRFGSSQTGSVGVGSALTIMMSGWGLLKNARFRYGVDEVLPLSDHADFDELIELVERVRPRKVFTHHGYKEFAETLRGMGIDATLAKPEAQLQLFDF